MSAQSRVALERMVLGWAISFDKPRRRHHQRSPGGRSRGPRHRPPRLRFGPRAALRSTRARASLAARWPLARKPKWRMRWKPSGRVWRRKRRMSSPAVRRMVMAAPVRGGGFSGEGGGGGVAGPRGGGGGGGRGGGGAREGKER